MHLMGLYNKYRHIAWYGIFGVLTTVVNIVTYWLMAHILHLDIMPSTLIAWLNAVCFAYVTNRKWVFHSEVSGAKELLKEILSFFACRIATGVVDWICMFVFVELLYVNDVFIKIVANILVIILNYIASKLVIFKKKKEYAKI